MWKAAFGGRSERGGSTFDDAASTSSRRRRHRRGSNDDKSVVSSTSRRTDGDRKRVSRNDTGVSYGSAPIPRLTESAVNAFNANDDDDDIWEDEADLKSERRSKRSESRERGHRRKSSGRSERSRSRERESSSKHKKSSGRSERSRSRERERDGWVRKSNGRSERSRSRERDDKDRKRKDEKSSRVEQPNGNSRILAIMDEPDNISAMPSSVASYDRFPPTTNPSTVRFDEHTMSGALDPHVANQFPGQNPSTYTKPDFDPNPHGAAADYYNDKGQSVRHQPGERAYTPNPPGGVFGSSSVAAPSGSTKPTKPTKTSKPTKQSSSSSSTSKPSRKSSRAISPPASTMTTPLTAIGGAAAASAANHHMQARASTQYDQSELSQTDFVYDRPLPSTISGLSAPIRHNSEPLPPTVGAASSYYNTTTPGPSGMYAPSQTNTNTGKYAATAAGAAAAGVAAYGMSQHDQHDQRTQYDQHTRYSEVDSQYGPPPSYGPQSQYGSQAPFTPERYGSQYGSTSGGMPMGMHHHHEHKGPISRLKDGFLNLLSTPEDVAKMEEYTEYIGVCKHCFDPRSSPYAGPRKHHYHPRKKDSFETLRRRSLERMQRRRSDESLRRTSSKVHKENRYFSSDRKSSSNSNANYLAGGLAVAGAATAGAAMFNDRKNFDDTYSVKSGHRATSAVRRRGSGSSFESKRRTSRGRVPSERHEEFITVRTKDGRVENRKVNRSRSGSTGRKSNWIAPAAIGAVGAAAASRHRRRSSPDQGFLHHDERRYRSRSSSRSHSPGLGEIFGFTETKPRRSGRRSPFGSYQDSRKEQQHRKEKGGFFTFSNGSASSSESGMAFGDVNGSNLSRRSSGRSAGKRKVSKQSSDEKLNKTLLGIGATAAALTAASKLSKTPKQGPRPSLGARRDVRVSQYGPSGHKTGAPGSSEEGEWVDELPSDVSSDESALAFDDGNARKKLSSRPSVDSLSSQSSNDGLSAWGWRWGSKKQKKQRPTTPPDYQQYPSTSTLPIADAGIAAVDAYGRRAPSDVGLVDNTVAPQAPLQYIEPQPLSEAGSRFSSMPGAFEDPPLQQPQPIAPFQPAFTQASPEDPLRPTAGPTSKPALRRSASSPTQTKGSFMGDAAFIGGAAVATAGIIASQNRKSSPGNVRFGFNGEQQEKYDRELREEKDREDRERRRADRTRALKEEAERFAREEDEKRVLAEQKRRQREEEDREHQRQLEISQREEAYRREQAQLAEESRRRAEQEREAEERERQMSNDRQIREELERKQKEREEKPRKGKGKKKDTVQDEEPPHSSWKGPVAAGMAGAVAGAVLDGALHKEGRERAQNDDRSREAYSTQTFEPTYEHSGAPITDDDLIDPDFFKRRHSAAELQQYDELSREKLDELTHEREDYYNMPPQSQKDFFAPKELLEKQSEGKERVADPFGDNDVVVYPATGGEARHVYGNDYGKYGQAPFVHQNVPKLHVTAPTPPHSTAGSTLGDKSAAHSPLTEVQNAASPALDDVVVVEEVAPDGRAKSEFYQRPFAQSVSDFTTVDSPGTEGAPPVRGWVEGETNEEEARHMPGGFNDSVYGGQQQPSATATEESAWEPPLSKKDKKKREKAGKRDSEPVTPQEEEVPAARSVAFDEPQETFEAPLSKKDKKKKGKAAKQASTFDDEPIVVDPERVPEPEQTIEAEPLPIEEDFAPTSKKDKKKKGKKGAAFEEPEPAAIEVSQPDVEPASASPRVEDNAWEPPLSKKEQKKRDKAAKTGLPSEDSQPSTPVNEHSTDYIEPEPESTIQTIEPGSNDTWEPPLSKKEKKKREKDAKLGKSFDDFEQASPLEEPDEPLPETRAPEEEPAWEPPLSKKDKKKREKEAKQGASYDSAEPSTPVNEAAEPMSASRELDAEPAWEPPLSKKDKKKREKEAKNSFAFDEPSTPPNETAQQDAEPLVEEVAAAFEAPLSKKEKKKREKEAQRQSLGFDDPAPEPSVNESQDPLVEQTRELDAEPLVSNQEASAEPAWEPPLSKKDKKKREKEGKRQSVSFEEPELVTPAPESVEAEQSREADAEAPWEPPLSKKEQKRREKEAKNQSFGDVAAAVMTTAGVAAIADAVNKPEDEDYGFDTGKKSKKNKKSKGQSFDDGPSDMPGGWDESSSDAAKDPYSASTTDRDIPRDGEQSPAQEPSADDFFGSGDSKKSKKKKKRESGRFSEPAIGSPLRSEIAFDDYVGDGGRNNGTSSDRARSVDATTFADAEATGYGRGGRGPSYYDDDYPSGSRRSSPRGSPHGSRRGMSPDDTAQSAVSAPTLERRRSSKSKSKRSSGVYEGEVDFDDTRSIRSSATEPAFSSKKEKKSGLFGLFSRSKSSDGDKRDQSFLGDRVEDLPPLPLDSQTSTISASAQEEQDRGNPATAEPVDQAVIADASNRKTQSGEASAEAPSPDSPAFSQRPGVATRPLSSTSVPLRFKPIPSSPSLPKERSRSFGSAVESAPISPSSVSASGSHKKPSRPRSSEFREVRPLYLVSRNSKLEDVEEQLPDLPESKPSSRASSVQGSEDWHSAAEDMSPQPDADTSPRARKALTIDLDQANKYRTEEEIMDTADQTTPKASDFPQTALHAPRSHPKQVPQFYTWEDLAKDEEMHEAAARQAEGSAGAILPEQDTTEGLGIVQDAKRASSPPRKSSKKDKRKSKGLGAAAALVGGAAAGVLLADDNKDKSNERTLDTAESDAPLPTEQISDSAQDPAAADSGSIYHAPVAGSGNTDIWGDPLGDAPEQADADEDVWGDEEFADRPSLPREMTTSADQDIDPMAMPAEGATPARTGGPMTNMEEDFDDWFGSTDPTPKTPLLIKGKKGKKAKKGKAAQAKPTSPAVDVPAEEVASSPAAGMAVPDLIEAEQAAKEIPPVDQVAGAEEPQQPTVPEQLVQPEDSEVDTETTNKAKSEEVAPETTQASEEASREITTESPAVAPADATEDFFAPISTKKQSKKGKKGKKSQAVSEEPVGEPVETLTADLAPSTSEATENILAEGPAPGAATPEVPSSSVNDPAGTDSSPQDDDWASMSTSKKGKKAKKGKKQKSDSWAEPVPESESAQGPFDGDIAPAPVDLGNEAPLAVSDESQTKQENETAVDVLGGSETIEDPAVVAEPVGQKSEPALADTNEPTPSTELAVTADKEAAQQPSSRGWFSWPWGAKKAADEGLEVDPVTMQAREMPEAAQDPKPEVVDTGKQSDDFVTPEEKSPEADRLLQDADPSTSLPNDSEFALQDPGDQADPTTDSAPKQELADRELDAAPAIKQDETSVETTTQPDLPAEQQNVPGTTTTADDQNPPTPAEQNEVAEDLWAAPSSKKKKGKKGKKSGQTTPLVTAEEPVASTAGDGPEASDDKALQQSEPQTPPSEAREVTETVEPPSAEGDTFWTPEPSKKKKGKKGKKSDPVTEELPAEASIDVAPASEASVDPQQAQGVSEERAAPETVGTPKAEEPEETDSFWTPQSTKKKGKKAKKTDSAASTPWDELVEEDTPIETTSGEAKKNILEEPQFEPQNDAANNVTAAVPESTDPAAAPAADPSTQDAPEPSVDDIWDALPSKKKGKKGKKAAKEVAFEPITDDPPPPQEEAPLTEAAAEPQDLQPNESAPEQAEPISEQPSADSTVEQETPAAEPEDFWAPQPKSKKGKKGKKAKSDPTEESPLQPTEPSFTLDDQVGSPALGDTGAVEPATDPNEIPKEVPEEAAAADFWEPPAKGKKAKKGKKSKGGLEAFETPSEPMESTPEPQAAIENAEPQVADATDAAEAGQESPLPAEVIATPEQIVEPEPAADDDWSALTTSKKAKKGKKGKKAVLEPDPEPSDLSTEQAAPESTIATTEPPSELPSDTQEPLVESPKDTQAKSEPTIIESSATQEDNSQTEPSSVTDLNRDLPSDVTPQDQVQEGTLPEQPKIDSDPVAATDVQEVQAPDNAVEVEPTSTKKSKKDKKKNKKAQALETDESLQTPTDDQPLLEKEAQTDSPADAPLSPEQEETQRDVPAHDESAATPAEEVDEWGSFATTKKSKKDKKKAKKGKNAESEELVAAPQPDDSIVEPSTVPTEDPALAPDATSTFTPAADPSSIQPGDQALAADIASIPAAKQEGEAADYYAGHPEDPESATKDLTPMDQAAEEPTPASRDTQPAADVDPMDDFGSFATGKSKKDKKKAKKAAAASSWDASEEQGTPAGDETPAAAADAEPATIEETQPAETDPAEEFGASSSKKSKKDKKKSKKNAADPWDVPEAETAPAETAPAETEIPPAGAEPAFIDETQPTEAEPAEEFGAFSSKKSKKDKKKAKKTAADSWDVADSPTTAGPDAQSDSNVISAEIDDVAPSPNQDDLNAEALNKDTPDQNAQDPSADPSVEARSLEADADTQGDGANADEEFSVSTKKSKKDKKKSKKSKNAGFDEPSEDTTASPGATLEETLVANEPAAPEAPLQDANATAIEPLISATPDNNADAQPIAGEPNVTSDELAPALMESSTTTDGATSREVTQNDAAQGDPEPENDEFGSFSSKKAKKDKKKAKKAQAALSPWEEPEISTPALEPTPDANESAAVVEEGPKEAFVENAPETSASQEPAGENEPTPALVEPQEDTDYFGSTSTKKSKKDKKKAKKSWTATPDGDEFIATERNLDEPMDISQHDAALGNEATLQHETVDPSTEPAERQEPMTEPADPVAEDDGDAFGSFSSKKSKKDKKKAKKAQEADVQVEDSTPETPAAIDEAPVSVPDSSNDMNALQGTEKSSNDPIVAEPALPETVENQPDSTVDDAWAAPTKKSKKDKKKGKKAQEVEFEAAPADGEANATEPNVLPESTEPAQGVSGDPRGQEEIVPEAVDQQQEAEAEDLWATPAKKSKKDKKKAKKAQFDEADPEAVATHGDAKPGPDHGVVLDTIPAAIETTPDTDQVAVDTTATPATEQSPEDVDAWGSISTKKSKKDKKKSKKTQLDEPDSEIMPVDDNAKPAEQEPEAPLDSIPVTSEFPPDTNQIAIGDETTNPAAEQSPEDADAWGSLSTKKSKKDKKKSKKAKTGDEDLIGENPATPANEEVDIEAPAEATPSAEVAVVDAQEAAEDPWAETSTKQTKKEKRKSKKNGQSADTSTGDTAPFESEPLERGLEVEPTPLEQPNADELPVTPDAPLFSDMPDATLDTTTDATRDLDATKSDEQNSVVNPNEPVVSEQPGQDIDFAATLAAGLADSGFDPNLVVDDPVFHRRASPTNGTAEADPEEVFMTSGKKKKGKSKKTATADVMAADADASASAEQNTDDFDAALSQGLQDSGFDPSLLTGAISSSQEPASAELKDEEDEFAFTKSNKKKKKGKKDKETAAAELAETDAVLPPATDNSEPSTVPTAVEDTSVDPSGTQTATRVDDVKLDSGTEALGNPSLPGAEELVQTVEDEWAIPSKTKKKSKKDKKQQDRSLDVEDSVIPAVETTAMETTKNLDAEETSPPTLDAEPETPAQSTEVAGEDEWGVPSKKKKGKKGKKQQDSDWQDGDNTSAPAEPSIAPSAEDKPDQMAVDELPPVVSEQSDQIVEDEWAAPSLKKKKGKKNKKNVDLDLPGDEIEPSRDITKPADASNDPGISHEPPSDTPFDVTQDNAEPETVGSQPAAPQPVTPLVTEEIPVISEATGEDWAAPSKKKDKKNKKKKGVAWDEPEAALEATPDVLIDDTAVATEQVPKESDPMARDIDGADNFLPTESAEPTAVPVEVTQAADDEWAAPSKKKKGKKSKQSQDAWAESDTPAPDTEPSTSAAVDVVEASLAQPESQEVSSTSTEDAFGGATEDATASAIPSESVTETAEAEWGLSSKKKGKKNKKKQGAVDFEPESQPDTIATEPTEVSNDTPAQETLRETESVNDKAIPEDLAAMSPAPADAGQQDDWALPIKKKGKKGKKTQMSTEDPSEAPAVETSTSETLMPETSTPETSAPNAETNSASKDLSLGEPTLPTERSLDAEPEPVLPSTPIATTTQPETKPETTSGEDEWGLLSKKKGKKNKKKGAASDADLDPFTSAPMDSPAPTSATDTAEASAAEGAEPAMHDALTAGGEMDVDEMDKAYKAYKKNKRKQKKMQNSPGDEKQMASSEQNPAPQISTDRGLGVPQEAEPVRQPSPLANAEPSWSFATLDNGQPSGEPVRRLSRPTSNGSLTSRRSMEPLHLDTGSRPTSQGGEQQQQQQQHQPERPGSSHGRTESRDTPLEPTSRNRASYLFQSPAPFPEPTSDNASSLCTPEQRGDASDYFHSVPSNETFSPPAGPMSPRIALDPIPEEFAAHKRSLDDATNITPMEPAGKMQRRTDTPKAIREQELSLSTSRDSAASAAAARSVSNPIYGFAAGEEDRSLKRVVSDTRSPSAMSNRSNFSVNQHVTPEDRRTMSRASNRSVTPTLRRTHLSGDLRAASRTSNQRGDAGSAVGVGARTSPKTIPFEPPPTPPLNDEDDVGSGATRAAAMAETFQGYGGVQQSQVSPTRPPSMRKRQSMHVMDLESKLEQLTSENRALQEAQQSRGLDDGSFGASGQSLQQTLDARELELREKNNEIQQIQAMLEPMQQEINRLVQINGGLTEANRNLVDDTNGRYATLQNEHAHASQQWQSTTRELENLRQEHSRLSNGMRDAVAAQLSSALAEKDHEIRKLKQELEEASERIRALQVQIQSSKTSDFLNIRDEDYFDGACQKLCQHVQQWVLRFSKMSDNRICRLSSDLRDEKIEARLDNALLDGMDVDKLLGDRVRRRDVFMSVVMTMVWEYVFTRYLFGMDREQRQKLKALEKTLSEVGPPRAVAQWRATTLTLLSKRPAFSKQCSLDTEAVAHEIFGVLSALLTPPTGSEQQLLTSLTKVITVAVNLSVEMRTQRAEYIMLPPLQPEYDTNGDLVRKVHFNASLMNERSGLFTSNEALEAERAIVKIVLFPLVVKKGDEFGEGEEEIVVCPAQVLVHNDSGKSRKVVRVLSGAMEIDDPRRSSKQSLLSGAGSMQF